MDKDNLVEQLFLSKSKVEDTIEQMVLQNRPGKVIIADAGVVQYTINLSWQFKKGKAALEMNISDGNDNLVGPEVKSSVESQKDTLVEDLQFLYGELVYKILDDLQKS